MKTIHKILIFIEISTHFVPIKCWNLSTIMWKWAEVFCRENDLVNREDDLFNEKHIVSFMYIECTKDKVSLVYTVSL